MHKLSIITVNLNNSAGLRKTIESVVNQTFSDYEYIIIDGGSTDGSVEIIKEFADKITYWLSEPDKGIYNAMNKGIKVAKGEYCLFLNSGDWLVSNFVLDNVFSEISGENVIFGNVFKFQSNVKTLIDKGFEKSKISLGDIYFGNICHQSSFIKKSLFDKFGLYNEEYKIVSDWAFFLKIIGLENVSVKYINVNICYYDLTGISSTQKELRYLEKDMELKKSIPENLLPDYEHVRSMFPKVRIYEKLKEQYFLWSLIRLYNKLFGRPLW
jgi:glycosyltransferase involved in cell wall biosynthesis